MRILSVHPNSVLDRWHVYLRILFQDTFERAKSWVKELDRQARKDIVIALAGNKFDLSNKRMVEVEVSFTSRG